MNTRNSLVLSLVAMIGVVASLGACGDVDETTGPPIPTLEAAASGTGVETVAGGELDAQCGNCVEWGCSIAECGYDTATDPRGACCLDCDFSQPSEPQPTCEPPGGGGPGSCSDELGAGEFGVDFCNPGDHRCLDPLTISNPQDYPPDLGIYFDGFICPAEFVCCYGGNYGDGPY